MDGIFLKQSLDQPLFPGLLWSRPENKLHAGKLLIVGGNASGFKAPAEAYRYAVQAGAGSARIILPDALRKTVGEIFLEIGHYAPSTPSGSFGYRAFAEFLAHAQWADGVLLAGDFGKNSETAGLLEYFLGKYQGQITLTGDSIAPFLDNISALLKHSGDTTLVVTASQLQKIGVGARLPKAFVSDMPLQNFAKLLEMLASKNQVHIITIRDEQIFVAAAGQVSVTPAKKSLLELASSAAVWLLQNPEKPFEALTMSVL